MTTDLSERRPFADFTELRHRFDQMVRDFSGEGERGWVPSVDLVKRDDELVLKADIPGIKPDEVKITVEDDVLTVSGEHEEKKEEERGNFVRRERRYGSFSRSLSLPRGVKAEDIEATTEDGVLEVTIPLPKAEESSRIEIKPKPKEG
ncbi:MAG: Hsp20/alpha crystallin family protein [Solirubrobacterales bacterium]